MTEATREAPTGPGSRPGGLARSMVAMTALTGVSRVTGFVRIVVVAAVLGTTYLGNTYQSANTVPNVLFELAVAGVVQAVLIPALVVRLDRGERAEAEHVAGAVLGLTTGALAVVALIGALLAPLVSRVLFAGVADPAVRAQQVRLGTVFLWFFLPQVVCYAAGLVATGVLHAHQRFALPAVAPLANNVVVIASCGLFWWLRDGAAPSLDLRPVEVIVLAGGATLGVVAFTGLPVLGARRTGFALRPNLDHRHPEVRALGRKGAWAGLFLAATQILLVTVLVLGNRVEGGVVAYQVAFQFFLLPFALFALPVTTALFPSLSRLHALGDGPGFATVVERGVRTVAYLVAGASALLAALGGLISRAVLFGETTSSGAAQVAGALVGFAPGLVGYSLFIFGTRVSYARNDTRTPAMVNLGVVAAGSAAMAVGFAVAPVEHRVAALALGHSVAYLGGAVALFLRLRRSDPTGLHPHVLGGVLRPVAAAVVVAGLVALGAQAVGDPGRAVGLGAIVVLGVVGFVAYVALTWVLGGPRPDEFVAALRGRAP